MKTGGYKLIVPFKLYILIFFSSSFLVIIYFTLQSVTVKFSRKSYYMFISNVRQSTQPDLLMYAKSVEWPFNSLDCFLSSCFCL